MSGPRVTSGKGSEQSVGTPRAFLDAVEKRFGIITLDLAADETNRVCDPWISKETNSLSVPWLSTGLMWLNPPYSKIEPWAKKCARRKGKIALLVPASVGTNWFAYYVDTRARVLFLRPRMTFVGHKDPYPRDLILAVYGETPGYECWNWKEGQNEANK